MYFPERFFRRLLKIKLPRRDCPHIPILPWDLKYNPAPLILWAQNGLFRYIFHKELSGAVVPVGASRRIRRALVPPPPLSPLSSPTRDCRIGLAVVLSVWGRRRWISWMGPPPCLSTHGGGERGENGYPRRSRMRTPRRGRPHAL